MKKKLFLTIWLNLILVINVSSQIEFKENTYIFAPDWEEFSIEKSEVFTPSFYYQNVNAINAVHRYTITANYRQINHPTYFFIFSEPRNKTTQTNKVIEFIKYSEAKGKPVTINNFPGKKFRFLGKDSFYHNILTIKARNRAYIFQTTSELDQNSISDNFFAGIRLHQKNIPSMRVRNGQGGGFGTGKGSTNDGVQGDSKVVYTPLIILSKPPAEYTDFALFYEIAGTVGIGVTYLESGVLGEIKAIRKLPFGLTQSALEAAKLIKFKPPTANGRPYSISRGEYYEFSISKKDDK